MLLKDHNGIPLQSFGNLSIAAGELNGYESIYVSGLLCEMDKTDLPSDIWIPGGTYAFSTSAATHYISSSDNADDQQIKVVGLDENWEQQIKFVNLVGQTKTTIEGKFLRINSIHNVDRTSFAGTVYVYEDNTVSVGVPQTASKIRAVASSLLQVYRGTIYTVPANKTAFIIEAFSNVGPKTGTVLNDKGVEVSLYVRDYGHIFCTLAIRIASLYENTLTHHFPIPYRINEKTDIKLTCTECFVDNSKIFAGLYMVLMNN